MSVAATIAPAVPSPAQAPIRVMIVDDAVVVRGLVSRWIEEEPGLKLVASLRTGREAVAQVERSNPDVVVLDVEMPELDGASLCKYIKANPATQHLRVIFHSVLDDAQLARLVAECGADGYVRKMTDLGAFADTIAALMASGSGRAP